MLLTDLLTTLDALGIEIQAEGETLHFRGSDTPLTDDLRTAIREHKPALLELATQNTHNTQKSREEVNSAICAICAYPEAASMAGLSDLIAASERGLLPNRYCFLGCDSDGLPWECGDLGSYVRSALLTHVEEPSEETWFRLSLCAKAWFSIEQERLLVSSTGVLFVHAAHLDGETVVYAGDEAELVVDDKGKYEGCVVYRARELRRLCGANLSLSALRSVHAVKKEMGGEYQGEYQDNKPFCQIDPNCPEDLRAEMILI